MSPSIPQSPSHSPGSIRSDITPHSCPPRYSTVVAASSSPTPHWHVEDDSDEAQDAFSPYSTGGDTESVWSNDTTPTYTSRRESAYSTFGFSSAMTLSSPPGYSMELAAGDSEEAHNVFSFAIQGGSKTGPWATLRLQDKAEPIGGKDLKTRKHPRFSNVDDILGTVELRLATPQTIKNIKLVLKGKIITSASQDTGSQTFLEHTYIIWDRKSGDPRQYHTLSAGDKRFDGRLEGNLSFPFRIPFPTHVDLSTLRGVYCQGDRTQTQGIQETWPEVVPFPIDEKGLLSQRDSADVRILQESPRVREQGSSHISPFYVDSVERTSGGYLPEKSLSSPTPTHLAVGNARDSPITPFLLDSGPPSMVPTSPLPQTPITPYTHIQELPSAPPSSSKTKGKAGGRSRWSFTGSRKQVADVDSDHWSPSSATFQVHSPSIVPQDEPSDGDNSMSVILPPSFLERSVQGNTQYELTMVISSGRFSSDSRVKTNVVYAPVSYPPPMSLTRQIAYEEGTALLGPSEGPDGWHQLDPILVRGTYLQHQELSVEYTLYLAKPLSYARSTVIPCALTIRCDNVNALNLLANPRSPRIRLRRLIRFLSKQSRTAGALQLEDKDIAPHGPMSMNNIVQLIPQLTISSLKELALLPDVLLGDEDVDHEQEVERAVWWLLPPQSPSGVRAEQDVRTMQGEIYLSRALQPSCKSPLFTISYVVEVLAPACHVFEVDAPVPPKAASHKNDMGTENKRPYCHVYASQAVEVTTDCRVDEPAVTSFTRPVPQSPVAG